MKTSHENIETQYRKMQHNHIQDSKEKIFILHNRHYRSSILPIVIVTFAVLVLIVVECLSLSSSLSLSNNNIINYKNMSSTTENINNNKPFSLLVTLTFISVEYKNIFLNDIQPLALYIKDNEPDTLSYEILQNDTNELQVLVLERYRDKDNAFVKIHRNSIPFLQFRPKLQSLIEQKYVTMTGQSYYDSGIGFGDRVETK